MKGGNYIRTGRDSHKSTAVIFSLKEEVGALAKALQIFQKNDCNLLHIESRSSQRSPGDYEFIIECDTNTGNVSEAMDTLRDSCTYMKIISRNYKDNQGLIFFNKVNSCLYKFISYEKYFYGWRCDTVVPTKNSWFGQVRQSNPFVRIRTKCGSPWIYRSRLQGKKEAACWHCFLL